MELVENRRVGRPKTTTMGINERVKRYRLAERCAEFTPQVIALWKQMVDDKKLPYVGGGSLNGPSFRAARDCSEH